MRVSFHATIRDIAGVASIDDMIAIDVDDLISKLKILFGDKLHSAIMNEGSLREDVVILVNGHNILHTGGMKTLLKDGDEVAIFPPVSGG